MFQISHTTKSTFEFRRALSQRPRVNWLVQRGFALILALLVVGCGAEVTAPAPASAAPVEKGKPQAKLPTVKLLVGSKEMTAEIARRPSEIETGMMWRTKMGEDEGMIFIFDRPHQASFWMKNTLIPLSCAYIDSKGIILEIRDMKPRDETGLKAHSDQVQFVLETPQGWFERNDLKVGTLVTTELGTLQQTFFQRP